MLVGSFVEALGGGSAVATEVGVGGTELGGTELGVGAGSSGSTAPTASAVAGGRLVSVERAGSFEQALGAAAATSATLPEMAAKKRDRS